MTVRNVSEWTPQEVAQWLDFIGLGHLKQGFLENAGDYILNRGQPAEVWR